MSWFENLEREDIRFFLEYLDNSDDIPHLILDDKLAIVGCNQAFLEYTGLEKKPLAKPASNYLEHTDGQDLDRALNLGDRPFQRVNLVLFAHNKKNEFVCFKHYRRGKRHYLLAERIVLKEEDILNEFTYLSNRLTNLNRELTRKNREMEAVVKELKQTENSLRIKGEELEKEVAERKRVGSALKKAKMEAEKANALKSEFLAIMSHEIRNPMSVIIGVADLLAGTALEPDQENYTSMIKDAATSLLDIINDILDHSKIEAGKMELEQLVFNLSDELVSLLNFFKYQAESKGLNLESDLSPAIPSLLRGDPRRLRQVLVNLLSNAIKFTEQGMVKLAVRCRRCEQEETGRVTLEFAVSDTGIGIASEKLDQLFKSYSQGDLTINRKYGGTGLGLVITRQLVELMGGKIEVSSREGKGSVFSFNIPLAVVETSAMPSYANKTPCRAPGGGNIHALNKPAVEGKELSILLVEDKELNRRLATIMLEKQGWRVTTAADGLEALQLTEEKVFDLVLMDIQMPVMNGLEATQRIRKAEEKTGRHLPIVAMTAEAMKGDREKFISAGMDSYISKPVDTAELCRIIESLIEKGEQDINLKNR